MRLSAPLASLLACAGLLAAGEAPPATPKPDASAKPEAAAKPDAADTALVKPAEQRVDPTTAVVAEGRFIYRQRDLDALLLVAQRHHKGRLGRGEEQQLREAITQALTAREALLEALRSLPASIDGTARDQLVLDLLDYQADPAPARRDPSTLPERAQPAPPTATGGGAAPAAPAQPANPAQPTDAAAPVIVRLPPLIMTRSLDGIGKRQLTLGLALLFKDQAASDALAPKAPLFQDAVLSYLQQLPAKDFAEPNQVALKDGIVKAVRAKVPDFPADGLLIPQLEVEAPAGASAPDRVGADKAQAKP